MSIEFFDELKKHINSDGSVLLPEAMNHFRTEDGGTMNANIQFRLRLVYDSELVPRPSPGNDNSIQRYDDE